MALRQKDVIVSHTITPECGVPPGISSYTFIVYRKTDANMALIAHMKTESVKIGCL